MVKFARSQTGQHRRFSRLAVATVCRPVGLVEFDVVLWLAVQEPVGGID